MVCFPPSIPHVRACTCSSVDDALYYLAHCKHDAAFSTYSKIGRMQNQPASKYSIQPDIQTRRCTAQHSTVQSHSRFIFTNSTAKASFGHAMRCDASIQSRLQNYASRREGADAVEDGAGAGRARVVAEGERMAMEAFCLVLRGRPAGDAAAAR